MDHGGDRRDAKLCSLKLLWDLAHRGILRNFQTAECSLARVTVCYMHVSERSHSHRRGQCSNRHEARRKMEYDSVIVDWVESYDVGEADSLDLVIAESVKPPRDLFFNGSQIVDPNIASASSMLRSWLICHKQKSPLRYGHIY